MGKTKAADSIKVKGFYRLAITNPDGSIDIDDDGNPKDSGWLQNQVTNDGFQRYLCYQLGSTASGMFVSHVALGNGTIPASAATSLDGEVYSGTRRKAVSAASVAGSKGILFTATFESSIFNTATTIANIGLFNSTAGGTLFAGSTFTSSAVATNQAVNCSYQINFSG